MPLIKSVVSAAPGRRSMLHTDTETGDMTVQDQVDIEPILNYAKIQREAQESKVGVGGSRNQAMLTPVMEIPVTIYNKAQREQWTKEQWRRFVNDPENAALRITKGRF